MTAITPDRMIAEDARAGDPCGPSRKLWISEAGGLTQFGAFVEILPPGSRSSIKHWHSAEDELVYVLDGEVTLVEGDTRTLLRPGDAATFRAGVPVGHSLENRGPAPARFLIVGTRAATDTTTYPDIGLTCRRAPSLPADIWTDRDGNPASCPYD
ncbi:Cupin 2 conserved barrel domain protein [Ancylobacter novellus DSM 506]|uniref:Cupin 2 conserved barrel domain protein n=1 Tax=Ancylobacter novellus (strain ATCC 8093 / DSM 506 / JCM 20403 / CCM 1077 / IAM 12100 / NBRC 12443 / NCIMB 10456) TaxID=639283 RepID=D7A6Q5_ANCN5|nr:cupin domain-containing protein [Ancylobacter novellus]ADH90253.1 Cupin 2 conserved barrel domain protein [Ancylobacter novellus DSM 506]